MKIIDPNSPLIQALGKLSDIIICNIMFVLFSLPMFTVGASLTALCSCMQRLIEDREDDLVAKDFWRAFKSNFKQATVIWLLLLLVILLLIGFFYTVNAMIDVLGRAYLLPYFLIVILFLFGVQYVFPIQARYRLRIRDTLKNAWLLSIAALPWTLCGIGVTAGMVFLTFVMMSADMCLFIWAIFGFALLVYLTGIFHCKAFLKLDPVLPLQTFQAPDGAIFTDESHRSDDHANMHQETGYSNPNWNRQEYPLSDRSDVQGKGSRKDWKPSKKRK